MRYASKGGIASTSFSTAGGAPSKASLSFKSSTIGPTPSAFASSSSDIPFMTEEMSRGGVFKELASLESRSLQTALAGSWNRYGRVAGIRQHQMLDVLKHLNHLGIVVGGDGVFTLTASRIVQIV